MTASVPMQTNTGFLPPVSDFTARARLISASFDEPFTEESRIENVFIRLIIYLSTIIKRKIFVKRLQKKYMCDNIE